MKTIKVIDLLNMMAKGEIPKKIIFQFCNYTYSEEEEDYIKDQDPDYEEAGFLDELYVTNQLNKDVVIEDKEKAIINLGKMGFVYKVEDKNQNANNERFKDFINEIIDVVNGKGKSE